MVENIAVNIRLCKNEINNIDNMIENGYGINRSDIIRKAIGEYIINYKVNKENKK